MCFRCLGQISEDCDRNWNVESLHGALLAKGIVVQSIGEKFQRCLLFLNQLPDINMPWLPVTNNAG